MTDIEVDLRLDAFRRNDNPWTPTFDAADALVVVDRMRAKGWFLTYHNCPGPLAEFMDGNKRRLASAYGDTFQQAVSRAAANALDMEGA